ncbi:MAG: 16S rRNA (cytosine(967)-C(5))-methyltransferase RsmB [Deltaproteobacteria bacterium]
MGKRAADNDPRRLAFKVLLAVETGGAFADAQLGRALDGARMDPRDRRLATLLVYGTLARQGTLDFTLAAYSKRPLENIDADLRVLARMGLFQIAFLDRVPAWAAVDSTVTLARGANRHGAGFVNALLRRASNHGLAPVPAGREGLVVELSHPRWLVDLWIDELGEEEASALMEANNQSAPTVVRALGDRGRLIDELCRRGIEAHAGAHAPQALVLPRAMDLPGLALAQGEASQLTVLLLDPQAGQRVLDACARPGGKSAYAAQLSGTRGRVVAVDPAATAAASIGRTLEAAGVDNVDVVRSSIEDFKSEQLFDRVLVDAPCSGLGTLRQHPEVRWRLDPRDIDDLAQRQASILRAAASLLKSGGRLVYSTCTLSRSENDAVVDAFLAANPEFYQDPAPPPPALADVVGKDGRMRSFPHLHNMDGFFAVPILRR